jgi:hypothetical protein
MPMDDPVARALADLAEADASRRAPAHLDRAVLAAFDRRHEHRARRRSATLLWRRRREAVAAAAAVAAIAVFYLTAPEQTADPRRVPERPVSSVAGGRPQPPAAEPEPLAPAARSEPRPTPRPPAQPHRPAPADDTGALPTWRESDGVVQAVHVMMPREMLIMLGVPIIEPGAAGAVSVEVLLGDDGLARAIRVVP